MSKKKPYLVLDFDGVLHSYSSGWKGATCIPDKPVVGAIDALFEYMQEYTVCIHSSRSHQWGGRRAMKKWLHLNLVAWFEHDIATREGVDYLTKSKNVGFEGGCMEPWDIAVSDWAVDVIKRIEWPLFKPPAILTIDDRGYTFKGTFPTIAEIKAFRPWYK